MKEVLIVGSGVAGRVIGFSLAQQGHKVQIISSSLIPSVSLNSTAIVCLRGTSKGISALGDKIYRSYEDFKNFYHLYEPTGVTCGLEHQLWNDSDHTKWSRRYPQHEMLEQVENFSLKMKLNAYSSEAYFITPDEFLRFLDSHQIYSVVDDYILEVKSKELVGVKNSYCADQVILCTSHFQKSLARPSSNLLHSKTSSGSFVSYNIDLDRNKSFCIAYSHYQFIYRHQHKQLLIGSTTDRDHQVSNVSQVKNILKNLESVIDFDFKNLTSPRYQCGIRHKAPKRMPHWGLREDEIYEVYGLYKNGWSFAFSAAKDACLVI